MKKVSPIIIAVVAVVLIVLGLVLFGSDETTAQESKILVTFSDGSTDRVTVEQIDKFRSKYANASVEVTGRIDSISYESSNYLIRLENGIYLWVNSAFVKNSNIDVGDYVEASGVMYYDGIKIKVGQATEREDYVIPLDNITFVK